MSNERRLVHHPSVWRHRATLTRLMAEHVDDLASKQHQLRLAALYEDLARYAEERVACSGPGSTVLPPTHLPRDGNVPHHAPSGDGTLSAG